MREQCFVTCFSTHLPSFFTSRDIVLSVALLTRVLTGAIQLALWLAEMQQRRIIRQRPLQVGASEQTHTHTQGGVKWPHIIVGTWLRYAASLVPQGGAVA